VHGNKGKKFSEEHKNKLSKAHLGRKFSQEHIKKLKESHLGYFATEETRKKMSVARRGKNSYLWKGGITDENLRIRQAIEFRLWREAVFARDNWTCKKCYITGGKLNAHHIKNFSEFLELRFSIDNGITFCQNCHRNFHKKFGIKYNNEEQINYFLNKDK